jgi:multiple sugar transport system permease protein
MKTLQRKILFVVALTLTVLYLFPLYWMFVTAFKSNPELFRLPPTFWPENPVSNIGRVFRDYAMGRNLWNSLVIASGVTAVTVLIGTGAAYALAQARSRYIEVALFAVLVLQALPPALMVTPIFTVFQELGLLGFPRLSVVLAQISKTLPFYMVLMRSAFVQIPRELREAALVDGATPRQAFLQVVLPLARNSVLVTGILVFLQTLGEYVFSRSLILDDQYQTTTVALAAFVGDTKTDWVGIMTYAAIYTTPILIAFMLLQRRIVSGLTAGALK